LGGSLGGIFSEESISEGISQSKPVRSHWHVAKNRLAVSLLIGLAYSLCFGWSLSPDDYGFNDWLRDGCFSLVLIGVSWWLLLSFFFPFLRSDWIFFQSNTLSRLRLLDFFRSLFTTRLVFMITIMGGATTLSQSLSEGLSEGLSKGVTKLFTLGLEFGLGYGLIIVMLRLILLKQITSLELIDRLRWNWKRFLKRLTMRTHRNGAFFLIVGAIVIFGLDFAITRALEPVLNVMIADGLTTGIAYFLNNGLMMGMISGVTYGVISGLTIGLNYWLLAGLYQSIESETLMDKDRHTPNQGIHDSARNSRRIGIISFLLVGLSVCSSIMLSSVLQSLLQNHLYQGWIVLLTKGLNVVWNGKWFIICSAFCCSLLVSTVSGGLMVLRHTVLRLLLWRTHTFPLNAPHFLEDAKARNLLRRGGDSGGYSFMHYLLQNHLTDESNISLSTLPTKTPLPS